MYILIKSLTKITTKLKQNKKMNGILVLQNIYIETSNET